MTEPKRWSSPGSEADPVLRSVLRYGQELGPSSQQLQRLLQATASRPPRRARRWASSSVVALAAVLGVAGGAWAAYLSGFVRGPVQITAPSALPSVHVAPAPRSFGLGATPVQSSPALSAPLANHAVVPSPSKRLAPPVPSTPALDAEQDAALLQQARRAVGAEPARALTLTRDHELHFPNSALTEERQALRVEALARLGRSAEAAQELAAFNARFPRSIYGRRLHTLLNP